MRLEAYRGLAILTTNMKTALDPAFLRRLRFIVNFPFPGPDERRVIWQRVFPAKTPTQGLDFDRLARLTLTGGSVQQCRAGGGVPRREAPLAGHHADRIRGSEDRDAEDREAGA